MIAFSHRGPPDPRELTSLTVTFTVKLGLEQDLSDYNDGGPVSAEAMAFVRQEIEGCLRLTGNFNGDKRDPIPMGDVEFLDYEVEVE